MGPDMNESGSRAVLEGVTGGLPIPAWIGLAVILVRVYVVAMRQVDRLTALATWDGLDPYVRVAELAERFGSDLWWTCLHPRTPPVLGSQSRSNSMA